MSEKVFSLLIMPYDLRVLVKPEDIGLKTAKFLGMLFIYHKEAHQVQAGAEETYCQKQYHKRKIHANYQYHYNKDTFIKNYQ